VALSCHIFAKTPSHPFYLWLPFGTLKTIRTWRIPQPRENGGPP
jgi:hypothetical protein